MASVDTSIHAHATGAAAQLVAAHAAEEPLKLYGGWFCPFVQRAWIVLAEKRIAYQYIEINPYHKAADFLALNPRGLVPTLAVPAVGEKQHQTGPRALYESTVVCEYLNEAYADEAAYGPQLLPEDAYERARCRLWIDHIGTKIVPAFYKLLQHTPLQEYTVEQARSELHAHILTFAREMKPGPGPWFLGDAFSLVDVMLAPWAKRLWLIDHYKPGGLALPAPGPASEDAPVWARWRQWFDAVVERKSVLDTWNDEERYVDVYKRYAEDTTNSLVGQATRLGKRLP